MLGIITPPVSASTVSGRPITDWLADVGRFRSETLSAGDPQFGIDRTGATNATAALKAFFERGGDLYVPAGDYLIAAAGPAAGGLVVNWTKNTRVRCHPDARFFTNGLDARMIYIIVPSTGAGLPATKISFEWVGGKIDKTQQKNSQVIPFLSTFPPPPERQGLAGVADGISFKGSYTDGSGNVIGVASRVRVARVNVYAGDHWQNAGGDSGIFIGDGIEDSLVEGCFFQGCRDQGIYGSNDGTGRVGGRHHYRSNSFKNCFFGCAVKRSVSNFEFDDNLFVNCVAAMQCDYGVGEGSVGGKIHHNRASGVERMVFLDLSSAVDIEDNLLEYTGAVDASGAKLAVYGAPIGIVCKGSTAGSIKRNRFLKRNSLFSGDNVTMLSLTSTTIPAGAGNSTYADGTVVPSGYFDVDDNFLDGYNSFGSEVTGSSDHSRFRNNRAINTTNPQLIAVGTNSTEVRTDTTTGKPVVRQGMIFADGSASAAIVARQGQSDTGIFFSTNKVGISVTAAEKISALSSGPNFRPSASNVPINNGDMTLEATSNTTATIRFKGSDGTVRSAVLTLA